MTLHEAMVKLLKETGRPMTTKEIADALNKNGWYTKKNDNPIIIPYQIIGRAKKYPRLFNIDGSTVSLIGE